jgi:TRAP-type mannitol/chloroaromatic compound transport system permease small subunit
MSIFISLVEKISKFFGIIASLLLIPLAAFTGYEVLMRYVFKSPTIWVWDLNIMLFAGIVMLGGADLLRNDAHVKMDFLVNNFRPKNRAILDLFTSVFFYIGFLVLLVLSWNQAWMSWESRETMSTIWAPPYYPMKMLIPIGTFLLLLQGIANTLKKIAVVFNINKGD